jgi:hypothetical protein
VGYLAVDDVLGLPLSTTFEGGRLVGKGALLQGSGGIGGQTDGNRRADNANHVLTVFQIFSCANNEGGWIQSGEEWYDGSACWGMR